MTPQQHLDRAESMLAALDDPNSDSQWSNPTDALLVVLDHTLIAIAVELGAPHAAAPSGGPASG